VPLPQHKTYSPADILLTFAGILVSDYMDGVMVTADRNSDLFKLHVGATGSTTRVRSLDKSGIVVFTVKAEAAVNDALSSLVVAGELPVPLDIGTLSLTNLNSSTLVEAPLAWIQKVAKVEYGQDASGREYTVCAPELFIFNGGALF
jgi:hypothetical protein